MADITSTDQNGQGAYRMDVEGTDVQAELTWHKKSGTDADVRVADHTFTPPEARGKGIALMLVEAMIADARQQGFTVVPQCPYVAKQFDKHPDWADLRA